MHVRVLITNKRSRVRNDEKGGEGGMLTRVCMFELF